jgi:hypothetical protein
VLALAIDLRRDQPSVLVPGALRVIQNDGDAEQPGPRRWSCEPSSRRMRPQASRLVDVGPDGEPRCEVRDDAQLDYVEHDEDGGYDGAVRLAFYVRGMTMPCE